MIFILTYSNFFHSFVPSHLGVDENTAKQLGEVLLQDAFQVFDSKSLLPSRKGRERRVFLFELFILFAKESKPEKDGSQNSSSQSHHQQKSRYIYKNKMNTSDLGVTEHVEHDECKFAIWTNNHHNKIVLKSHSIETKLIWIKKLRELIQENTYFTSRLSTLNLSKQQKNFKEPSLMSISNVVDTTSNSNLQTSNSNLISSSNSSSTKLTNDQPPIADRNSIASYSSSNTTDSDKFSQR